MVYLAGTRGLPGVDDRVVRAVRDKQRGALGFESKVVPALIAGKRYLVSETITRRGIGACRDGRHEQHACERDAPCPLEPECVSHGIPSLNGSAARIDPAAGRAEHRAAAPPPRSVPAPAARPRPAGRPAGRPATPSAARRST